jgi:hypothetical protein
MVHIVTEGLSRQVLLDRNRKCGKLIFVALAVLGASCCNFICTYFGNTSYILLETYIVL